MAWLLGRCSRHLRRACLDQISERVLVVLFIMEARKWHDGVIVLNSGDKTSSVKVASGNTDWYCSFALCVTLEIGSGCITSWLIVTATGIECTSASTVRVDADLVSAIVSWTESSLRARAIGLWMTSLTTGSAYMSSSSPTGLRTGTNCATSSLFPNSSSNFESLNGHSPAALNPFVTETTVAEILYTVVNSSITSNWIISQPFWQGIQLWHAWKYPAFSDLKEVLSNGCRRWVQWGGNVSITTPLSRVKRMTSKDLWLSLLSRSRFTTCMLITCRWFTTISVLSSVRTVMTGESAAFFNRLASIISLITLMNPYTDL